MQLVQETLRFLFLKWLLTSARPPLAFENTEPQRLHSTLPFSVSFRQRNSRFSSAVNLHFLLGIMSDGNATNQKLI